MRRLGTIAAGAAAGLARVRATLIAGGAVAAATGAVLLNPAVTAMTGSVSPVPGARPDGSYPKVPCLDRLVRAGAARPTGTAAPDADGPAAWWSGRAWITAMMRSG